MPVFYRSQFDELWMTLRADEVLGFISGDYLEDYFGNPGQLTLVLPDDTKQPLLMNEVTAATPSIPHDVFTGVIDLTTVPNGVFSLQGRVRDELGNYTIIGAVENPIGTERVLNLTFTIAPGNGIVIDFGPLVLTGGISFAAPLALTPSFEYDALVNNFNTTFPPDPIMSALFPFANFDTPFITELEL